MGTSAAYDAPPSWGNLKSEVTRAADEGSIAPATAQQILRHYVHENGGVRQIARGATSGGGGGRVGSGAAARQVAGRVGGFVSDVAAFGLPEALKRAGLSELIGRPVADILNGLLDKLGGPGSTMDDVDARAALSSLQEKLLADAADAEAVEQVFTDANANIDQVLQDFFGFYLYEQFCRVFYERLVQRVGEMQAQSFLGQIREFILSSLANRTIGLNIAQIDWPGSEGAEMVSDIMEATLAVFGS